MAEDFNVPKYIPQSIQNAIVPNVIRNSEQLVRRFVLGNVQILKPKQQDFSIDPGVGTDPQLYQSLLGTPVLVDLTFHGTQYTNEQGFQYSFPDIVLYTVLLTVSQTKNIVKTAIQGRKGTVKEYIGMGDYQVNIAAIITGTNGVYPREEVQSLITMCECNTAITVTSWYLNMFGINSIVIDSYDIGQDEGAYSRQPLSISTSSDYEVNLRLQ